MWWICVFWDDSIQPMPPCLLVLRWEQTILIRSLLTKWQYPVPFCNHLIIKRKCQIWLLLPFNYSFEQRHMYHHDTNKQWLAFTNGSGIVMSSCRKCHQCSSKINWVEYESLYWIYPGPISMWLPDIKILQSCIWGRDGFHVWQMFCAVSHCTKGNCKELNVLKFLICENIFLYRYMATKLLFFHTSKYAEPIHSLGAIQMCGLIYWHWYLHAGSFL